MENFLKNGTHGKTNLFLAGVVKRDLFQEPS